MSVYSSDGPSLRGDGHRAEQLADARERASVAARAAARTVRQLGFEPAANRKAANRKSANGKAPNGEPRPAREHEFDNKKREATCAFGPGKRRGLPVDLQPTGCPFDRAHNIRGKLHELIAAAAGGRRMKPITMRDIDAEPRLYPANMLRVVRFLLQRQTAEGTEYLRISTMVGPDSQTELQHEYAERVANETGVNLFGGNVAEAVHSVLARGGAEHLERRSKGVRRNRE